MENLAELEEHLRGCCLQARDRTCGANAETVGVRLARNLAAAGPLPARPFDACVLGTGRVDKYQTVAFDGNRYSVPRRYAFGVVTVRGFVDRVEVVADHRVVATHRRSYARRERVLDPRHFLAVLERKPAALDHAPVSRDWHLPPAFAALRAERERRRGARAGVRESIRALQLLTRFSLGHVARAVPRPAATRRRPPSPRPPNDSPGPATPRRRRVTTGCHGSPGRRLTSPASTASSPVPRKETTTTDPAALLRKANLKALRLPAMLAEHEKLAREAAGREESYDAHLLTRTELEVATRTANAVAARVRAAGFPVAREFDAFDSTAMPSLPKPKALELARGEWVERRSNVCLIGGSGTGKTHVAGAWGLSLCRPGKEARFVTAAGLVAGLEEAHPQHRLDRTLAAPDRLDLLIADELRYLSFSRSGAELLFQVFADRYERRSLLVTSNLPFGEWGTVFQGERMTAALLDRLTHRCEIFEMNGESYRFRESMKSKPTKTNPSKK